ncbi:Metalloenzyme, LuxS/M16 peptidase-like protein [Phycomyces nitens]|nr:Metalloenzyme, LuxS/M16 peptidase-like protein [Phycomyces nitens]
MTFTYSEDWVPSPKGTYQEFKKPIEKPENDERLYRVIQLHNKLEVTIISDPETDISSAALSVSVGSMSDPPNLQGLAHFCEHLLFMGTQKYPKENDYFSYVSDYAGYTNASTYMDYTVYYFEVGEKGLKGALDRFSRFFVDPLFTESCTERELKAVDSEYKKNLQSDTSRILQLSRSLYDSKNPMNIFATGNIETLKEEPERLGLDVRKELLEFHKKYYSANIMKLCVLGKESLEELTEWVVEMFSVIPNTNIDLPTFGDKLLTSKDLMKQVYIKSIADSRSVNLIFPFPDQAEYYDTYPPGYLCRLLNAKDSNSCEYYLKKKGWAIGLNAMLSHEARGVAFFQINVDITEEGLNHHEEVVQTLFQYIEMIKSAGVQKWIFEEIQSMRSVDFRFSSKSSPSTYTEKLVNAMGENISPQVYLSAWSIYKKYDPKLIQEHLDLLMPDNFEYFISSNAFPVDIKCSQTERWYRAQYEVRDFSEEFKERLKNPGTNAAFKLPTKNELIPTVFEVAPTKKEYKKKPDLIKEEPGLRIWYKQDDRFFIPKTFLWIDFKNPSGNLTLRHAALKAMYVYMVDEAMSEYNSIARSAGLVHYIYDTSDGLTITINGYSHKLSLLLEKLLHTMTHLTIDPRRFEIIKDDCSRSYKNFFLTSPYMYLSYYLSTLTRDVMWDYKEMETEIAGLKLQEVLDFCPLLLQTFNTEGFVYSAMDHSYAISIFDIIKSSLNPRPLTPSQLSSHRNIYIPEGQRYVYQIPTSDPEEINSAIQHYIQIGKTTDMDLFAKLDLMLHVAEQPIFDQLRTKEQLGYVVFGRSVIDNGVMGLAFTIQSERDTVYLENRVEIFLGKLRETIANMTEKEYKTQVDSLIDSLQEKPSDMYKEGSKYWAYIETGFHDFDQSSNEIAELKRIKKADLLAFFDIYIDPNSPRYSKLSIHLQPQKKATGTIYNSKILYDCLVAHGIGSLSDIKAIEEIIGKEDTAELPPKEEIYTLLVSILGKKQLDAEKVVEDLFSKNVAVGTSKEISGNEAEEALANKTMDSTKSEHKEEGIDLSSRDHTKLATGTIFITDPIRFKREMPLSSAVVSYYNFKYN